jgi:outer membrane protein OmpA-like peptidoglycan-associated protein
MCRWNKRFAAALAVAAATAIGAGAAHGQDEESAESVEAETVEVLDLTLPVLDLELESSSLDRSVRRTESETQVRVALAADVLFKFDSAALAGRARARIAQAVAEIRAQEPGTVRVVGHTDSKGSNAYNMGLSRRRAEAVRGALARALGGAAPRFVVQGKGESQPVLPNTKADGSDNPQGRARNRRVEILIPRAGP